ncbi:MAG: 1,2-phenylacetyl-CoA epoxidase subunit PaaC [Candidatus Eiseniibacteriota bacterium]
MKDREADLKDVATAESAQVEAFTPAGRDAILALLVTLGDNKYKLGRRYAEWSTAGPTLEASVAAASMTSDELGHARSLYPLLRQFPGAPPELRREEDRSDLRNVSFLDEPFARWADLIAACALFGRALGTVVESLRSSAYQPFRHRAAKVLQEEHYHRLYAQGWLEVLAQDPASRGELQSALKRIWPETVAWFGPDDDPVFRTARAEGVTAEDSAALRRRFLHEVRRTLDGAGLADLGTPLVPWSQWDAAARRLGSK